MTTYNSNEQPTLPSTIDDLLSKRNSLLKTKLDVFSAEISERLKIRSKNLYRLLQDECNLDNLLHMQQQIKGYYSSNAESYMKLHNQFFSIERERREQDVNCWRDVVMVMKDFLQTWEAYEHAKSKAQFLTND